jgi:hypothetical protein
MKLVKRRGLSQGWMNKKMLKATYQYPVALSIKLLFRIRASGSGSLDP